MDNLLELIEYRKDSRLETIMAMKRSDKPLVIYGAGKAAILITKYLKEYELDIAAYAVDSQYYKEETYLNGIPVYDIGRLSDSFDSYEIFIGFENHTRALQVKESFKNNGIQVYYIEDPYYYRYMDFSFFMKNSNKFQQAYELLEDELSRNIFVAHINSRLAGNSAELSKYQSPSDYNYDYELMDLTDDEYFVDCGAFDGDTVRELLEFKNGKVSQIYAFEPDADNIEKIKQTTNLEKVTVIEKGAGKEDGIAAFYSDASLGSNFVDSGLWGERTRRDLYDDQDICINVPIASLDHELKNKPVTVIKMDIEGSELDALIGAEEIIRNQRPKLAICVYHKQEDLFTIIQYIHSVDVDGKYKYYLRHHSDNLCETVLYAIPKK